MMALPGILLVWLTQIHCPNRRIGIRDARAFLAGCGAISALLCGAVPELRAQQRDDSSFNFPPRAKLLATPTEVHPDDPARFSARESKDPDNAPRPLTFNWDFGDGTRATGVEAGHRYRLPGTYIVTLTVNDGSDQSVDQSTMVVLPPVAAGEPGWTTPIVTNSGGRLLAVINPDSNSVSIVEVDSNKVTEIPVGHRPRTIALSADEKSAWVTNQDDNSLTCIDLDTRAARNTIRVGHQPYGVLHVPGGDDLLVTNQGDGTVMWIDSRAGKVKSTAEINGMPRAAAVTADGKLAYVSDYLTRDDTGTITVLEVDGLKTVAKVELVEDPGPDTPSSGRGFPNQLSALAISPGGESVWVGGLKSNTGVGLHRSGSPLEPTNRVRGMLAMIDQPTQREDARRRIDLNNADMASAIAFSPNGRIAYVTHQGAGALSAYDLASARLVGHGDGAAVSFASRIDVGFAPQGIALSPDGRTAYVANFMSRSVSVVDVSDPNRLEVVGAIGVTGEPLAAPVARGKQLFYSSKAPRMSRDHYTACASCHADGNMSDGRTWDFTQYGEGLRNTIDLRGRGGMAHGPVHWSANFDEIQDFEIDIVNAFGGVGLITDGRGPHPPLAVAKNAGRSADLDDLAAYLMSLTRGAPSPHRMPDGQLTEEAKRGQGIFYSADTGCAQCHFPPLFTDSTLAEDPSAYLLHDVGTLRESSGRRLGKTLLGIDTPTLKGLWDTAPYLHDGRAATLREVLTTFNANDRHGQTSHLKQEQLIDLAAFLLSIDDSDDLRGE